MKKTVPLRVFFEGAIISYVSKAHFMKISVFFEGVIIWEFMDADAVNIYQSFHHKQNFYCIDMYKYKPTTIYNLVTIKLSM